MSWTRNVIPIAIVIGVFALMKKASTIPQTQWDNHFVAVETLNKLPEGLLKKIAWRESRFHDDVVYGSKKSRVGAVGIMQILPKAHPENPESSYLQPLFAITYGGKYLGQLLKQFSGDVKLAVMAYNWGPGNVSKWLKAGQPSQSVPQETKSYVSEVLGVLV